MNGHSMPNISVNSKVLALDRVSWSETSLSTRRGASRPHIYRLQVELGKLAALMAPGYDFLVDEMRRDGMLTGERDWFAQAGYPELPSLLKMPELLSRVLETYYVSELFSSIFGPPKAKAVGIVIDGVDSIRVHDPLVIIEGRCYSVQLGA